MIAKGGSGGSPSTGTLKSGAAVASTVGVLARPHRRGGRDAASTPPPPPAGQGGSRPGPGPVRAQSPGSVPARRRALPDVAVRRLPSYLRALGDLRAADREIVSSADLAASTGLTSEQIRKDLAALGGFGTRGVGYRVDVLTRTIRDALGLQREVPVALVGAGHLGTALARYNEGRRQQPSIVAIFDVDAAKVDRPLGGTIIRPMDQLDATVAALGVRMAIIAVPAPEAQGVADRLVRAGCDVLLNFAPVRLALSAGVRVHNVDLAMELETLAYYVR